VMEVLTPYYRMIAPDLRGFGDSGKPDGPYDKRTVAADIKAIMDELDREKVVLIGHDIGARVALRLTIDAPERVQALIIIAGRYPPLGTHQLFQPQQALERWYFFFHQYVDLAETLVSNNVEAYVGHFLDHWSHPSFSFSEEDLVEYIRAFSQRGALRGGFEHYRAALNEDVAQWKADEGKKIEIPTLLLWGEDDPVSPPYYSDGYHRVFTKLTYQPVSQCGHFVHQEKVEETTTAIRSFLASVNL
jgi:haloacetate dehalogenase